jgi:PRC-barrel domain protein
MDDLGDPISYLTLGRNVTVYSSDGERVGRVVKVMSEPRADMFDGIVIDTTAGPGGHKFVDAPEVGEIYERGVILKIDAAEAAELPKPSANPGSLTVNPADLTKGGGGGGLRRFWDRLTGR